MPSEELDSLLLDDLRRALDEAEEQLNRGEFTDYDEQTIRDLVESVKARGQARLAPERDNGALRKGEV
jgi:hypothetical protein